MHPTKRIKRSHSEESQTSPAAVVAAPAARSPTATPSSAPSAKHDVAVKFETTPPPSPKAASPRTSVEMDTADPVKIDLEGINDEIVEAVIVRLQDTDNRPHLVKELTAILMQELRVVQQ